MAISKPTIDDVAALAGVGRTTVSRVLNKLPNVRAEVRERVLSAVQKLDFKVNVQARNLAGGTGKTIALVHFSNLDTEPNSYYNAGLELGALRACAERGFQLVTHVVNQNVDPKEHIFSKLIAERQCDGLILTPPFSDDVELIEVLRSANCAVVCISAGRNARTVISSVGMDDMAAGFEIANYLIALGHRRFGYIQGLEGHFAAESRFDGFQRALTAAGINPDCARVERGNFTFQSGIELTRSILEVADRPTALVCANDDMAAGALLTIHKLGLAIPKDISVTGFDDTPVSEIVWPPLTTIHQPLKAMGNMAVEVLINEMTLGDSDATPRFEMISHRLVIRESCQAVGAPSA